MKDTFKNVLSFEFWQKFGKALMVVIAVMPAAGLMISIGKSLVMINPNFAPLVITGGVLEQIGWGVIGNLHILFALAIGGSWAKERAGGAFAAGLAFILINRITGTIFGVSGDMLKNPDAMVTTLFGGSIKVADYFVSVMEAPALNMGVFVGIISGFVGATAYNKYYNFRKLPDALSFFNGKRFVPFVVILRSAIAAILLAAFWPVVQTGINSFGIWIANSQETAPILAPFLYGTLERLLLPFGLHHMLTIPMNYTALGGTYEILTGAAKGTQVFGQDPLWLAWVTDLVNLKGTDASHYQQLLDTVHPARFSKTIAESPANYKRLYDNDLSVQEKIEKIVTEIYRGSKVNFEQKAQTQIAQIVQNGWDKLPICMAKTQYSFSDNPNALGAPENFEITIRELVPKLGAGFIVALTGDVMTMPGLPKRPAALNMDVESDGTVLGLF